MIILQSYQLLEIILGISFFWFGIYLLSRNPQNGLSWATFGVLASFSLIVGTDPIQGNVKTVSEFTTWQSIVYLPLIFGAVIFFNLCVLLAGDYSKRIKSLVLTGYILASVFYILFLSKNNLYFQSFKLGDKSAIS